MLKDKSFQPDLLKDDPKEAGIVIPVDGTTTGTEVISESLQQVSDYHRKVSGKFKKDSEKFYYKFFKLLYQGLKKIIPLNLRLFLKKMIPVFMIVKVWKKPDVAIWPIAQNADLEGLDKYEYSLFSQNGEDGLLRYIFSEIGYGSRYFIEIGFEVTECNSLRLMLKEKLGGILIDGEKRSVRKFNKAARRMGIHDVKAIAKFLDAENLREVLDEAEVPEEVDLLSIDVDGNDYWFWESIDYIKPRVVMVEFNASLGPELSLAVPYDPKFMRHEKHQSGFYCSASISAFNKLAEKKGYSLIGCDSNGVNAFFVRKDCFTENIRQLTPQEAFRPHKMRLKRGFSQEVQYNTIKDMPYISI